MGDRRRGFTLLETLMVTGLVAVVSSIAVPAYFKAVDRGRRTEAAFVLSLIRASELRFHAENRVFTDAWLRLDIGNPNRKPDGTPNPSRPFDYTLKLDPGLEAVDFKAYAQRLNAPVPYTLKIDRAGAIDEAGGVPTD